jgi:transcriptional regulator with XRE-family HTH domain
MSAAYPLGTAMKMRRAELGLIGAEAAQRVGMNAASWSAVESGRKPPRLPKSQRRIEEALEWPEGTVQSYLNSTPPPSPRPASVPEQSEHALLISLINVHLADSDVSTLWDILDRMRTHPEEDTP